MLLRGTSVNVMPQQQVVPHSLLNAPRAEDALNKMQQNQKKNNTQRSLSPTADPQRAGAAKLDGLIPLKPVMSSTSSGAGNFVIPQSPSMLPSQKAPIAP
jgi:hypothetical protein